MRNANIDLIRGISVIIVFLYHAKILQAGHIGVDIFFVISGYLITTSIVNTNLSFHDIKIFYQKRVFRLFPPLLILFPFVFLGSLMIVADSEILNILRNGIFALIFASNVYGLIYDGYFSISSDYNPFRHMWSLSIEEQFYIAIIPLLFIFKNYKYGSVMIYSIFLLFFVTTPFFFYLDKSIELIYLSTFTRGWELCVGVVCAINVKFVRIYMRKITPSFIWVYLLIILLTSFVGVGPEMKYFWFGQSIVIVFLTAYFITCSSIYVNSFALKLVSNIGIVSYGFYVYHYPMLVFSRWLWGVLSYYEIFAIFIFTLLLSYTSHRYLEIPFQTKIGDRILKQKP